MNVTPLLLLVNLLLDDVSSNGRNGLIGVCVEVKVLGDLGVG